jgi:hypothetical protein
MFALCSSIVALREEISYFSRLQCGYFRGRLCVTSFSLGDCILCSTKNDDERQRPQ